MPDVQIHPTGTVPTPADYVVPDSAELRLKDVYAKFDGSGAAGSYLPLVRIISDAGSTVIEAVADTPIAAGASADVSWFPHLAAPAPSGGIKFDTANVGDWLQVETTDTDPFHGGPGILLNDSGGNAVKVESGAAFVYLDPDTFEVHTSNGFFLWEATGAMQWTVRHVGAPYDLLIENQTNPGNVSVIADHGTLDLEGQGVTVNSNSGDLTLAFFGNLLTSTLPTADPGVSGALWNNLGVVHVSP